VADVADALADRDALSRALARLPADQQLAVHLRLVEGYSFAEVGRLMGKSGGACQMLVLRAGRQLREALEREGIRVSS
jgi:RNA polymerase sigma factor (sigma-70 family)